MNKLIKFLTPPIAAAIFGYGVGLFYDLKPLLLSGSLAFVTLLYCILLSRAPGKPQEKGIIKNVLMKLPVVIVLSIIVWFAAGHFGFPVWWQIEFVAFTFVGLVFFVVLDLRTMAPEKTATRTSVRLLGTYGLASVLFITITAQLPQFDPQVELAKLNKPPVKLSGLAGPEVIAAGRRVFEDNKCFNCHKVFWEGNSDRGPNLGTKQIGLFNEDYLKEQIVDPRKIQSPGFDDPKSYKAMPTYYGEDLSEDELNALVSYLKTMRDPTNIPVEGKLGEQWTWYDDPKIIEEGKLVYEGKEPAVEGLNCSVCHGTDGIPLMTGALDFRKADNKDSEKFDAAERSDKILKDWPDALWYKRVTQGVPGTPMAAWGTMFPHLYLWKAIAYERTFHDPLDQRASKVPIPPIPTEEEIKRWKDDGLFMDPLL
ncbi:MULTISPECIES: c-type cytochrome [unclassified Nitrospina]|uniref:c-type cytochrome n=1 Tax=unclassified Nitrospina TaxID=2638683 RepID=UPI003F974190